MSDKQHFLLERKWRGPSWWLRSTYTLSDNNKAKAIATRINEKIAQYDFSALRVKTQVTVSIGVATMIHARMSFDDILHGADLAMYQAKEQGRNTVVCYHNIADTQERRSS